MMAWSAAVDAPQLIANNDHKTLGSGQKSLKTSKGKAPKPPAAAGSGAGAQDARSVAAQPAEALHPSQQTKPRAAGSKAASSTLQPDALYPTWLLATPQRLAVQRHRPLYQGPLTLLAGPQRIEAAWWEPDATGTAAAPAALRDYFVARSAQAGLLWIYRERLAQAGAQPGWFLHGLFA
jgi:protein ImuB